MITTTQDILEQSITVIVPLRYKVTDLIEIINCAWEENVTGYWEVQCGAQKKAQLIINGFDHNYTYQFKIKDYSTSEEGVVYSVDADSVKLGIERILRGTVKVNSYIVDQIRDNLTQNQLPAIDTDAVDCILQAGLFGEIVYA